MQPHLERLPVPSATLTRHAARRSQQRSIPLEVIDLLNDFGDSMSAGSGYERCSFSKRAWRKVAVHLGPEAKHYERYRSAYIVIAGGSVITVGWIH